MQIIGMSDVGNVRKINQDYVRYYKKNDDDCLVVLCDGMGGHNAGEIASQLAGDTVISCYLQLDKNLNDEQVHDWLNECILYANAVVKNKSKESIEYEGMGTTMVLAYYHNQTIHIAHVGDSRAYLFEKNKLFQITKDDTLVNVLVASGTISESEALNHPQKNILLQAVGVSDRLNISYFSKAFSKGEILICSDGLYNSLDNEQISAILSQDEDLQVIGDKLMAYANEYGGMDNIGFAILKRGGQESDTNE